MVVGKCGQVVGSSEQLSTFCFLMLGTCQGRYKSCHDIGHAYQPHLVLIQLRMLELNIGKGRQVITSMSDHRLCLRSLYDL